MPVSIAGGGEVVLFAADDVETLQLLAVLVVVLLAVLGDPALLVGGRGGAAGEGDELAAVLLCIGLRRGALVAVDGGHTGQRVTIAGAGRRDRAGLAPDGELLKYGASIKGVRSDIGDGLRDLGVGQAAGLERPGPDLFEAVRELEVSKIRAKKRARPYFRDRAGNGEALVGVSVAERVVSDVGDAALYHDARKLETVVIHVVTPWPGVSRLGIGQGIVLHPPGAGDGEHAVTGNGPFDIAAAGAAAAGGDNGRRFRLVRGLIRGEGRDAESKQGQYCQEQG